MISTIILKAICSPSIAVPLIDVIVYSGDAETDELENFEIAQQQAREDAYKAAKKGPGKYEDKYST